LFAEEERRRGEMPAPKDSKKREEWIRKKSTSMKKLRADPNSIYNTEEYREKFRGENNPAKKPGVGVKISASMKGKNTYARTPEHNAKNSAAQKKRYENPENRKKTSTLTKKYYEEHPDVAKERNNRPEIRAKNSISTKKYYEEHPESRKMLSDAMIGDRNPSKRPEVKAKLKVIVEKRWEDPEEHRKQSERMLGDKNPMRQPGALRKLMKIIHIKPNKPEKFLDNLFQQFFPNQIKYIGDGRDKDSIVSGRCPDFIFTDGQKKIIEFNGDYWHGEKITGRTKEEEEQQRIAHFAKEGYQTLIIWEHELEDIDILQKKIFEFAAR
jgi:G:T-mismatch repair DNA endonuclease (very short patch repair protein)